MIDRILIVGVPEETHVGGHFRRAAASLGLTATFCDSSLAYDGPGWKRRAAWWLAGHRPLHLRAFSELVVDAIARDRPALLLTTGLAPVDRAALWAARRAGVVTANFLTDDPWNPAHRAPWFFHALASYDHVFSPRRANIDALEALNGPVVTYLPFAYDPKVHFPDPPRTTVDVARYRVDVVFAGGADAERVRAVEPLIEAGFKVALYGGYWERYASTREHARGFLDAASLRRAIGGARICLCLVRRSNRDGHSMRSFEVPASGGCMLLEDTPEHRELFGANDDAVVYFQDAATSVDAARALLGDRARRVRLTTRAHQVLTEGANTYQDRLATVLTTVFHDTASNRDRRPRAISRV